MLLILWVHLDLIIPWKAVHERHSLESAGIVNHDIGDGQWEFIFRADCIEIAVVNTDTDFSILLKNRDNVSNPIWMLFLPYETTYDEFMDFGFNSFHHIRAKSSLLLLDWLGVKLDIQTMHGYLRIKSGHIFIIPWKDIDILSYEYYQFFFLRKW